MLPDRSGPRAHDHGHTQRLDTDLEGGDWSANELAAGQRLELDEEPDPGAQLLEPVGTPADAEKSWR